MIPYRLGQVYLIRHFVTRAGTYFEPREILNYQGHIILFGEVWPYAIYISRGSQVIPGKPVAFPQLNLERTGRLGLAAMALVIKETGGDGLTGRPFGQLRVSEVRRGADPQSQAVKGVEVEEEPLFSTGTQCADMWGGTPYKEGWTGRTVNRDGLIRAAQRLVDLYEDVLKLGRLPIWFRDQRRAFLNRLNTLNAGDGHSGGIG